MGVSTLFSHNPHVVVHDFTEFSINAKHFQLFEGKSKNLGCFADRQKIYADRRSRTTGLKLRCCFREETPSRSVALRRRLAWRQRQRVDRRSGESATHKQPPTHPAPHESILV